MRATVRVQSMQTTALRAAGICALIVLVAFALVSISRSTDRKGSELNKTSAANSHAAENAHGEGGR